MGSGLKAQNMTGIRAQRKGLRAQKNGIRDHKAFEPNSGIRLLHGLKISYHKIFLLNKVCVHIICHESDQPQSLKFRKLLSVYTLQVKIKFKLNFFN